MRILGLLAFAAAFGALVLTFVWAAEPARAVDEYGAPRVANSPDSGAYVPTASQVQRAASRRPCYARCAPKRGWSFEFAIPIWIPGVSGSFAEGGIEVDTDPDTEAIIDELFEVSSDLKFGFLGSFTATKGKWSAQLDGFGARLGSGLTFRLTDTTLIDGTIFAIIARAVGRYEFLEKPFCMPGGGRGCLRLDAYAGARFYRAGFDMDLPFGVKLKASENWIDPIVGLGASVQLSRKWEIRAESDIGGFDVGSKFAWWVIGSLDWHFARRWTLMVGYGFADVRYGSVQDFAWNMTLNGPMMGIRFSF